MTIGEELEQLKKSIKEKEKGDLRRAKIASLVLAAAAVLAILSVTYGAVQFIEAGNQRDEAERQRTVAEQCARQPESAQLNLERAFVEAEFARKQAEKAYEEARLSTAVKSKKK